MFSRLLTIAVQGAGNALGEEGSTALLETTKMLLTRGFISPLYHI